MLALGIDTSTKVGYVGLVAEEGCLLVEDTIDAELDHSAKLLRTVESALDRSGTSLRDLDCVGVGIGPGSLTGVRVGIAFAKGVVSAIRKPLVGVCSLEAIAYRRKDYSGVISVIVDAKMGGFYHVAYRWNAGALEEINPVSVFGRDDVISNVPRGALILSPDAGTFPPELACRFPRECRMERTPIFPSAEYIARRAILEVKSGSLDERRIVEPIYLRPGVLMKTRVP